jgi:hypothetical protein
MPFSRAPMRAPARPRVRVDVFAVGRRVYMRARVGLRPRRLVAGRRPPEHEGRDPVAVRRAASGDCPSDGGPSRRVRDVRAPIRPAGYVKTMGPAEWTVTLVPGIPLAVLLVWLCRTIPGNWKL